MTVEERIGAADRRRMAGNVLFKEEKLDEAMQQYEMVTTFVLKNVLLYNKYLRLNLSHILFCLLPSLFSFFL